MSTSISVSWSGRWMRMLSGEWFGPCQARPMRSPPIASGRRVEEDDAIGGGQERRLVGAVRDPVQVSLDASDVVPLVVESRAERRPRHGRVVRQSVGARRAGIDDRRFLCAHRFLLIESIRGPAAAARSNASSKTLVSYES